jgi:hypothetical protein
MATVHITLSKVQSKSVNGTTMPVPESVEVAADTITSSATSLQSSISPSNADAGGLFWTVTARDGDVWVKFGVSPTAGSDSGYLVLTGQTRDFGITLAGEKIAIKDA